MKFLLLDSLAIVFVVVITELFWLGRANLTWMIIGYVLVLVLQVMPFIIYREETKDG